MLTSFRKRCRQKPKMKNKLNKRADIAVTMLVLMTLVLAGTTLFILNLNKGNVETMIQDYALLNKAYLKENQMDFYINNVLDSVIKNFEINNGKDKFIEEFKKELGRYKENGEFILPELKSVEEQIQTNNFIFDSVNKKITFNLDIRIDEKPSSDVTIAYAYTKTFEKDL